MWVICLCLQGGEHYTKEHKFGEMFFSKFDGDYDPEYYKYYIVLDSEGEKSNDIDSDVEDE